ncbi:MAG TPA: bifunctional riboflavin kinase/FAD synthetase, partial [Vampirovibrionales bacterium]
LSEKVKYLEAIGVQQLVLLPFDQDLANMTPEAFVAEILVGQLKAQQISVGQDFCFGRQRSGTVAELKAIAARYGVKVHLVPLQTANGDRISSSAIRTALLEGNLRQANSILGRPYSLIGDVVQGKQIGRTLGFPTANLQLPEEKFLPRHGVYAVRVYGASSLGEENGLIGALNIGTRPTIDAIATPTVEVHLLDWSGDLYGKTLTLHLEHFLRPQQKFDSLDQLKTQIQTDCNRARTLLSATE